MGTGVEELVAKEAPTKASIQGCATLEKRALTPPPKHPCLTVCSVALTVARYAFSWCCLS